MRNFKLYYLCLLAMMGIALPSFAQTTTLTGSVKTPTGEAVIGANVFIQGTSTGSITDVNGQFTIQIGEDLKTSQITVSSIGYATQTLPIGGRTQFDVVLAEDTKTLQEVVVTGYQVQERDKVMGAVGTISPELINKIPVSGIDQALQGRIPGVAVTQNTGAPGEGVSIRVRGAGSINSGNSPLYIVDGVPTLDITSISPQDIATLTVLKEASEAAVYGARAANGVVVVTTKLGSMNKQVVQYSSQVGVQSPTRLIPMASTSQYINIFNESVANDNAQLDPASLARRSPITDDPSSLPNINQVKAIIRPNAVLQTHSLSFSGGEGKTRYLMAGSYFSQEGIVKSSDYKRLTARMNIDSELKSWLRVGFNFNFSNAATDLIGSSGDGAGGNGGSVLRYAYFRTPAIPIYLPSGAFTDLPGDYYTSNPSKYTANFGDGYNPVGMLAYNNNKKTTDRLFGKFFVILKPFEGFTYTSNLGLDYSSVLQRRFDRNWGTENSPGHGRINDPNTLTVLNERNKNLTFSNFAEYLHGFGDHHLKFLLGIEAIKNQTYDMNNSDQNFFDQTANLTYIGNGQGLKTQSETQVENSLLSYFGKVNYDYNNKYLASATFRRDGSSRFGPAFRWGNYYAGSVGWRIDKESFLINNTWIDKLLLRAGFGVIGNQEIANYASQTFLNYNYNYPFGGVKNNGYSVTQLGNTDVHWESSSQLNVGTDFTVLQGKLSFSLDFFQKTTTNLLVTQPLPTSAGSAGAPVVNNGKIQNRGVEFSMNYSAKVGDWRFTVSPNAAYLHNEVMAISPTIADGKVGAQALTLSEKGYQVGSFYLYEQDGIFQNAGEVFSSAKPVGSNPQPGDVKYKDLNGDGIIDQKDRAHVGSAIPTITGGLNLAVNYKNWDLSAFFQGAYGQKIFSNLNVDIEGFYRAFNVTERYYQNHWTPENPNNKYPRASWQSSTNNTMYSTRFLEDGSYTRLKNLQVGYTVPKDFLTRYGFSSLRIYFSGTNLLTFTKYSGMDPEMTVSDNSKNSGDRANGIDWGTYPSAKSYNVGINLTF